MNQAARREVFTISRRALWRLAMGVGLVGWVIVYGPQPAFLPLASEVDGPPLARATRVLVFLHGRGSSIRQTRPLLRRLRNAGLAADVSIVLFQAPGSTGFGHSWGDGAADQASSRARVRKRLHELLAESGSTHARVVVAGFSQGAGLAIDLAVEEPRISALASLSPCSSWLRGKLPERKDLRVMLAHGSQDERCRVEESRSLRRVLEHAKRDARYVEFDGGHVVPNQVVSALAAFTNAEP